MDSNISDRWVVLILYAYSFRYFRKSYSDIPYTLINSIILFLASDNFPAIARFKIPPTSFVFVRPDAVLHLIHLLFQDWRLLVICLWHDAYRPQNNYVWFQVHFYQILFFLFYKFPLD